MGIYVVSVETFLMKKKTIEDQLSYCESLRTRIKNQFGTNDTVVVLPSIMNVNVLENTDGYRRTDIIVPDNINVTTTNTLAETISSTNTNTSTETINSTNTNTNTSTETINQNVAQNVYSAITPIPPVP